MRVAQFLAGLVFLGLATLQFGDPDALLWVMIYVLVAANCAAGAAGRTSTVASLVLAAGLITWAAILSMEVSGTLAELSPDGLLRSEVVQELGGLLLAALWCGTTGIIAIRGRWRERE
jgi:hypothetical protein